MRRILVFETVERNVRIVERALGTLGYAVVSVIDADRLKLEIRAGRPDVILASADVMEGSGLDIVRDQYQECPEPVPVVAWSGYHSPEVLKEIAPVELLLGGVMSSPLDPGELVRLTTMLAPPRDVAAAVRVVNDLAAEERTGIRLDPPEGQTDLAHANIPRVLCSVDYHDWSGCLRTRQQDGRSWALWFDMGQLVLAQGAGRDLIATARALGRLQGIDVPDYPLRGVEDEVGLLMALRGIGAHEGEWIAEETATRLVAEILDAWDGSIEATEDVEAPDAFPAALPVLPLVLRSVRRKAERASRVLDAHPESVIVVRLPEDSVIRSWVLPETEQAVIAQLALARSREITVGQVLRVVAAEDPARRKVVEALLRVLWQIGFVHLSGRPFGEETTEKLDSFVRELHRLRRADHFEALGVGKEATDKDIRAALRTLSMRYHPDTLFDQHPRVLETAGALQARIQEAYDALKDPDRRAALRQEEPERRQKDVEAAKVEIARAKIKVRNKHLDEAIAAFRDATLLDPSNVEAKVQFAWTSFLADPSDPRRALSEMSRIVKAHGHAADPWYYVGRLCLLQKDFGRARRCFKKALTLEPGHMEATREIRLMDRRGQAMPLVEQVQRVEEDDEGEGDEMGEWGDKGDKGDKGKARSILDRLRGR